MDVMMPGMKPTAYNVMLKPIGPICNLNCTYCYYLEKKNLYLDTKNFRMTDEVLEEFTKQYIESQNIPTIGFVWQGGEPTMLGLDYFKNALKFQEKYKGDKSIENIFQTNGTLLTDDFARFFADNNFLVGVSIDGPEHLHNHHRLTNQGTGSFEMVMKGIELLHKHKAEFNTLSVVNKENSYYPLEIYKFLKDIGSGFLQFIPIVERIAEIPDPEKINLLAPSDPANAKVSEWSVNPGQYGIFLNSIFDEWVRKDVGKYYVQIFDVTLANWAGERPGLCVFSETCGDATAMEHNGDLFVCDHFVYDEYKLGNIMDIQMVDMIKSEKQEKFGRDKRDKLPRYCFECDYRFTCHGGCPKNRISITPQGESGHNYLCSSYKKFFSHVHPYMQFMADELKAKRPPANVMDWVKRVERQKNLTKTPKVVIGRNDPCPCGSGKKFKACCIGKVSF
ncbi:MAG: anaerobic sulfatase-maturation protein [Bacteroidales bacterium]|nr:anaerobic sulfatase-maturation protein [Bacteroidales bacterium]